MRIPNVVKNAGVFSQTMWLELKSLLESTDARGSLHSDMLEFVSHVKAVCGLRDDVPSSLGAPSRRAYCWVKFLVADDNLRLHLNALDRGRRALENMSSAPDEVELHMADMNPIWRRRTRRRLVLLTMNEGFIHGDETVWRALLRNSVSKGGARERGTVNEYIDSEEFSGVLFEMEAYARPTNGLAAGLVHDLDSCFDRVNAAYFTGRLDRPQLCWNNVITSRKFGHYEFARDIVMLSISLDDAAVTSRLVDYVMYHELLHKTHGVKLTNGRRMAHTSAFRRDERKFLAYEDAVAELGALARCRGPR